MFRLLGLGAMIGLGIGAYKFFKKKKETPQVQEPTEHCEQENC